MTDPQQPVVEDQSQQAPADESKQEVNLSTSEDKPDLSELVHKDALKQWVSRAAEAEQARTALKTELEKMKQFSLSPDEYQAWLDEKDRKERAAEERKKKEGKWEQILVEKNQEWSQRLKELESTYKNQLEQEQSARQKLEGELHQRLVEGQVRSLMKERCAEDVLDIAVRDVISGSKYQVVLNERRDLVVMDMTTDPPTQVWGQNGPMKVDDYIHSYLETRPSFKKARLQLGSDDGRATTSTPPPDVHQDPYNVRKDGSVAIVDYAKIAPNMQLIKEGIGSILPKTLK